MDTVRNDIQDCSRPQFPKVAKNLILLVELHLEIGERRVSAKSVGICDNSPQHFTDATDNAVFTSLDGVWTERSGRNTYDEFRFITNQVC